MSALSPWILICIHLAPFFLSPALEPYVSVIIVVYPVPWRSRSDQGVEIYLTSFSHGYSLSAVPFRLLKIDWFNWSHGCARNGRTFQNLAGISSEDSVTGMYGNGR